MRFFKDLIKNLSDLTRNLTDFLFPRSNKVIALENLSVSELSEILPPSEATQDDHTLALFDYAHPMVKEIVWAIKYQGNRTLAEKMGVLLYDAVVSELLERNAFEKYGHALLIPMPISDKRRFERGWNQAELLSKAVKSCDQAHQFKHLERQLVKIIHTESQTRTASKKERLENLQGSMKVINPTSVTGRCIILIDDVTTTGATFAEARRAMKEAGAKKIICFALAH